MKRTALITGITGQDGSYLAELLLAKGYRTVGVCRRSSVDNTERVKTLIANPNFELIEGDVVDAHNVNYWLHTYQPDEFYNLAAQSHVGTSFNQPILTWRVNAEGVFNILEGIRYYSPHTRFYQASTSEMFGQSMGRLLASNPPFMYWQSEDTPFAPQSPYAIAKAAAHHAVQLYRRAYNLHASCGILFNHESERRGEQFVTRKITKWIGAFKAWHIQEFAIDGVRKHTRFPALSLGNLDAMRDWGHAEDYVEAMWLMLQQDQPDDYVIGTGETYSVRQFLDIAFKHIGIADWTPYVVQDPKLMRPAEVKYLLADASKARQKLGWQPKVSFYDLVARMVDHDISQAKKESLRT